MFYRASPVACGLRHPWLVRILVSVSVGLPREVCSLGFPAGELSFLLRCLRGPQSKEELTLVSVHWISCARVMLNKHVPEATICFSAAGKSAAPCSFIFKLWLDEAESSIGEKTVYSCFSYFNRLPFVLSTSIHTYPSRRSLQHGPLATDRLVQPLPLFSL